MWVRLLLVWAVTGVLLCLGCGQREAEYPDGEKTEVTYGECGSWYPGGGAVDAGAEGQYAVKEEKILPCFVWESVRLNHEDSFINMGQVHLMAKHNDGGDGDVRAIVVVLSAENCPGCPTLVGAMADRADEIDAAGAVMIGMARRNLEALGAPDFDLDKAEEVLSEGDGWPVERWAITNDAEHHLGLEFDVTFPMIIVVSADDMVVRSANQLAFGADDNGVTQLLEMIDTF